MSSKSPKGAIWTAERKHRLFSSYVETRPDATFRARIAGRVWNLRTPQWLLEPTTTGEFKCTRTGVCPETGLVVRIPPCGQTLFPAEENT